MSIKFKILTFILLTIIGINISFGAIDMDVSPIKYEIEGNKGDVIKKVATIKNNYSVDSNIHLWKSNFTSSNQAGVPRFLGDNDNSFPNQEIASWITLDQQDFVLAPNEEKTVEFTINIPNNATPGGHYGAILFKNNNSNNNVNSTGNSVGLEINYAVLIILNVDGEVISNGTVGNPIITVVKNNLNGGLSNYIPPKKDDCPIGDLTISKYDGKCIDLLSSGGKELIKIPKKDDNFEVKIEIPFKNEGNTHIKPIGKIKLIDENGEVIKGIGRESKLNDNGAIIGDEVVDYIPMNDAGGNILPNSERNFDSYWKGFPYKSYDKDGNQIIKYWTPGDYYSKQNVEEGRTLMPWERVAERTVNRKIKAEVDITYKENNDKDVKYNSAKDFNVEYEEKYVGLNPYVVIPASFILFLLFIWFLVARKNKKKCIKCGKKISKKMKICPYCEAKQD